jgi:hypothetical protein
MWRRYGGHREWRSLNQTRRATLKKRHLAALIAAASASGPMHAQTTMNIVDTQLNVPSFMQQSASFTATAGSLFIEGASTTNSLVEGVGILKEGNTIIDTFALTNGTVGSPVFNQIVLNSAGNYTFSYDFANSNSTYGNSVHLTANSIPPQAPEIDPSSAVAAIIFLSGVLIVYRNGAGRKSSGAA